MNLEYKTLDANPRIAMLMTCAKSLALRENLILSL